MLAGWKNQEATINRPHPARHWNSCRPTDPAVYRKSAQKPADELYEAFKVAHPNVGPGTVVASASPSAPVHRTLSDPGAMSDPLLEHRYADFSSRSVIYRSLGRARAVESGVSLMMWRSAMGSELIEPT